MARKPTARLEYVFFDVLYQDGSQTSNRKVPLTVVDGLEGDDAAIAVIEAQDREIAERSRRPRAPIKSITRSSAR